MDVLSLLNDGKNSLALNERYGTTIRNRDYKKLEELILMDLEYG